MQQGSQVDLVSQFSVDFRQLPCLLIHFAELSELPEHFVGICSTLADKRPWHVEDRIAGPFGTTRLSTLGNMPKETLIIVITIKRLKKVLHDRPKA